MQARKGVWEISELSYESELKAYVYKIAFELSQTPSSVYGSFCRHKAIIFYFFPDYILFVPRSRDPFGQHQGSMLVFDQKDRGYKNVNEVNHMLCDVIQVFASPNLKW